MYCPLWIKLKVLNTCVNAALLYGSETWGLYSTASVERLHRKACKIALGVRENTPNNIVYIETGQKPLTAAIKARQFNFWLGIQKDMSNHPDSPITILIKSAIDANIPYVMYYCNLVTEYTSSGDIHHKLTNEFKNMTHDLFHTNLVNDTGGKLGTYLRINPTLCTPLSSTEPIYYETDRVMISRHRTGSHNLKIETGRWARIPRDDRHCKCGPIVQTIDHVVLDCEMLKQYKLDNITDIESFFNHDSAAQFLRHINIIL